MQSSQIIVELLEKLATIQNAIQRILASSKTASTNWVGSIFSVTIISKDKNINLITIIPHREIKLMWIIQVDCEFTSLSRYYLHFIIA